MPYSDNYSIVHPADDAFGPVRALEHKQAVIAGHDWGAPVGAEVVQLCGRD